MDYKSKKVAIISVLSTLLVVGAIAGTVAFIKGNNQSGAAENVIANEVANNIIVENVIDGDTNTNTNTNSVVPSDGGNAGGDGGNIAPVAPDNTPTTDENGNEVIVDVDGNSHVIGPVTNDDGSTTTTEGDGIGGYIQKTVIPEHMVWEWTIVDWTEILPRTIGSNIDFPSVEGEKYYTVDGSDTDTAAVVGQNVTYYIDVTNTGDTTLEQFRVVDTVPTGTELVDGTISDEGDLDDYGRVIWKLDLNPQETKTVSFTVTVISNEANPIVNKAKVNGEETNEVKTPVIETSKKAFVVEADETLSTRDAKVGEIIRYVISLTNNSDVEGTTTVYDTVPENTEFVSADKRFTVSEDNSSLEATISVPAGEKIELTFDVIVVDDEEDESTTTSVRNIAVIGGIPTPPVETKVANIKTVKTATPDEPLHELGKIHYELVSTNSGDGKGTVTITDTVPEGTELVPDSITNGGTMGEDGVITWTVTLEAGKSATSAFDVIVLPFKEPTITITNAEAKQDGKEIPPTETEATKEYKSVTVNKEFVDVTDNVDNTRPTTITVELSNNATDETKTQELNADNNWEYTFEKLDKYHTDKTEIEYDVKEIDVNSYYADTYETSKDGDNYSIKVINTLKYEEIKTEKVATKVWVDNDNTSGNRPTSVVLDLYADGEFLKSSEEVTGDDWTYTFTELQKYHEDGTEIVYTVKENDNSKDPHYTVTEEGLTVTNTIDYNTFKTTVSATKNWVDNSNKTNHRPQSIHLNVLNDKDEVVLENEEVTGTGDSWTYTSEEVPMYYDDGTTIVYSVKEVEEDQTPYETEYSDDTLTITNTINYDNYKTTVNATKVWVDNSNESRNRPSKVILSVLNNKDEVVLENQEVTGTGDTWTYTSAELPMYYDDGETIEYRVVETAVENYETAYSKDAEGNLVVTNTIDYDNYKTTVSAKKVWVDNGNVTSHRPTTIHFNVVNDKGEVALENQEVTGQGNEWSYTSTELPKYYDDGTTIVYSVQEVEANEAPYTTSYSTDGLTVTNTINYDNYKTTVSATKIWEDNNNKTNHRPTTIHLNVYNDKEELVLENQEVTGSTTDGTWTYTSVEVPMYYDNGRKIVYTVKEVEEDQTPYETTYSDDGLTVTNTIDYDNYKTTVSATKVWVDNNNNSGNRPTTIHLNVYNDKEELVLGNQEVTGNATDGSWTYTSEEVPMYYDDGTTIVYTVQEVEANTGNYKTSYSEDKLTVTNTIDYDNYTVDIPVNKTWDDDNDREEVRPDSVSFDLYVRKEAGDEKVSSHAVEGDSWTYTFTGLAKYDDEGNELSYYAREAAVPTHYTMEQVSDTAIKNKIDYTSFTIDKPVTKVWVDEPNSTHSDITFELWGDNDNTKPAGTHTLKDGETSYTFTGLQKYNADGSTITYTVNEVEEGQNNYTTTYNQETLTVTNTIVDPTTEITITKIWVDPDEEGTTHKDIDVRILQNGNTYKVVTIPGQADNTYTYTESNLPKYKKNASGYILDADGNVQNNVYTVEEITTGWTDYTPSYSEDKLTITNTIVEDNEASLTLTKNWVDDKTEHPTIKIWLTKRNSDGTTYSRTDKFVELPSGTTTYTFTGLQKYDENGQYIKYGVEEETVTGYTTTYNGNTITNTIEAGETSVTVEKTWIRPDENYEAVTIRLYQDGTEYDHVTFTTKDDYTNGKATHTFSPLPEYNTTTGQKYVYTTREDTVEGYSTNVVGTNKYQNVIEAGSKDVTVTKTWDAPAGNIPTITIILRDGTTEVGRHELVYPETSHTFEGLPKYNTTTGQEITYTVDEVSIEGYDTTIDGTNITNKVVEPNDVSITITKNWIDPSDMTHPDVKFILKQNGVQYPNENTYYTMPGEGTKDTTTLPITGLPRYKKNGDEYVKDSNGRVVENVYTVEEVVPTGYELIEQSADTYTVTNRILQDNTKVVDVTKEWSIPEGVEVTKPTITVNLLRDGTEVDEKQIVPPSTTVSFPNLPVYDLDPNSSRYGERYVYTVTEDEVRNFVSTVNGYTITNTFDQEIKGTLTFRSTIHGEADVKVPMDVVFVLDVSGSMNTTKAQNMVSAVNSAITYVMNRDTGNVENRVAVVTYSGSLGSDQSYYDNNQGRANVLLPLGTYLPVSKYLVLDNKPNPDQIATSVYKAKVELNDYGQKRLVRDGNDQLPEKRINVTGATYTQLGIALGANELISAPDKVITETIDGFEYTYVRTPVVILLSDGAPTEYTNSTTVSSTSAVHGDGSTTTENEVYWTVKTAKAYKDSITNAYYTSNGKEGTAKFYTVGYGISTTTGENQAEKVTLNPTAANINLLPNYDEDYWYGPWHIKNYYQEMYDKLHGEDSTLNSYSYSDGYASVSIDTQALRDFFTQSLSEDHTVTLTRDITLAESDAMKVYLPDIDTSKEFSLKINGTTYTSINNAYVKQEGTQYYVDLSTLAKNSSVEIFYTKVTQTAGE